VHLALDAIHTEVSSEVERVITATYCPSLLQSRCQNRPTVRI
jgi:hypothetical protein